MKQGMKPSSAVLERPSDSATVNCCICSSDFQPANYEERAMEMCQKCSKAVDETYMKMNDDDELNVSYFIVLTSVL